MKTELGPDVEEILHAVSDGITVQDNEGRLVYANEAAARVLGFDSSAALLAAPVATVLSRFEVMDEMGAPFPLERLPGRQALRGERPSPVTVRFKVRATGEEHWSIVRAAPIFNNDQTSVKYAVNVFVDITALKNAELAQQFLASAGQVLASSLDYEQTVKDIAGLVVPRLSDWCAVDVFEDGKLVRLAVSHSDPRKVRLGYDLFLRYPPAATSALWDPIRSRRPILSPVISKQMLEQAAQDQAHCEILLGLGIHSALLVPLITGDRVLGVMTLANAESAHTFSDIDLKIAEDLGRHCAVALANAELYREAQLERRRLRTLVEASPAGVFVLEAASRKVLLMNGEWQRITGLSLQVGDDVTPNVMTAGRCHLDGKPFETGELSLFMALELGHAVHAEEVLFQHRDGTTVTALESARPIHGEDGGVSGVIVVLQDISRLLEMERQRTQFMGMVSHELRTPLAIIKMASEDGLSTEGLDAGLAQTLTDIAEQADRINELIGNLLDVTQIEAGAFSVHQRPQPLGPVIEEAAEHLRQRSDALVELLVPEELPMVHADRHRVLQVVENLLINAAKFSDHKQPIRVSVSPAQGHLVVSVTNSGPGIPVEMQPYLFRKFFRANSKSRESVGLGLAICKGIVETHGGRIWVQSAADAAETTFSFTLPIAE